MDNLTLCHKCNSLANAGYISIEAVRSCVLVVRVAKTVAGVSGY